MIVLVVTFIVRLVGYDQIFTALKQNILYLAVFFFAISMHHVLSETTHHLKLKEIDMYESVYHQLNQK